MSSSNLIRWSGLACMAGGPLLAVGGLLVYTDVPALLRSVIILLGLVLIQLGLLGLYARQVGKAGALGIIGFLLAFIGTALFVGATYSDQFLKPVIEREAPALLESFDGPFGPSPYGEVVMVSIALFDLGWLVFGVATLRARVLPRWASLLLLIGVVLVGILGPFPFYAVVFGAALLWLGYALWSGTVR